MRGILRRKLTCRAAVTTLVVVATMGWLPCTTAGASTEPRPDLPALTSEDVENLVIFGKVWGYLKYHHPNVTAGCLDWDAELVERLPGQIGADRTAALDRLADWVRNVDEAGDENCVRSDPREAHFAANNDWLTDERLLGGDLSERLQAVTESAGATTGQRYVRLQPGVGNPLFDSENAYDDMKSPDWRYRLLGLYRFWNIIEYWFPYRNLISGDWDETLGEFIPRLTYADNPDKYVLELMALIARVEDTHANLWSSMEKRPPAGNFTVSAHVRCVENLPLVWRLTSPEPASSGLRYGDVILSVDSIPFEDLVEQWAPYYGVSNEAVLCRETTRYLLRGGKEDVRVTVDRNGDLLELELRRDPADRLYRYTHDREGATVQLLSDDVAYMKLSSADYARVPQYLEAIKGTRGLIIDIRNYPSSFMVFALGQHLVAESTPFARFTNVDSGKPGTFRWAEPVALEPKEPHYDGKVVILVDESSQSQAEYTAMAFRASPFSVVVGSQTAGADGNLSYIPLPGGYLTGISGIGVFYPDKTPTQKTGIVPNIEVRPMIEAMRAGRDEVLEVAVREILGDEISEGSLRRITRIPHAPAEND